MIRDDHRLDSLEEMVKVLRSSVIYNDMQIRKLYEELKAIREKLHETKRNAADSREI